MGAGLGQEGALQASWWWWWQHLSYQNSYSEYGVVAVASHLVAREGVSVVGGVTCLLTALGGGGVVVVSYFMPPV